jgi:hypothetical protein
LSVGFATLQRIRPVENDLTLIVAPGVEKAKFASIAQQRLGSKDILARRGDRTT